LPHYTSGSTFFYPGFSAARPEDALKFASEFSAFLSSPVGLEALTRVRLSRGLHLSGFHGNFFLRSTDLLAMPAVPEDQSYMIELEIDETITSPFVVMQCGILYTTALGERRIRVTTLALPTTSNLSEVYASVDQIALTAFLANKAVERTQTSKLEDARDAVTNKLIDIMTAYKASMTSAGAGASGQLAIAANMSSLPVLALGLLKHVALRPSSQIVPDLRSYAHTLLTTLPAQLLIPYLHPSFYSLHNMPDECGMVGEEGVLMPPALPLSSERLERHGLYLIEDGQTIFLWVGRDAVPQLIMDVFDLPAYDALRSGKVSPIAALFRDSLKLIRILFSTRCHCLTTCSRSVSMPSLARCASRAAACTTRRCSWSRKTASRRCVCGHSARSSSTAVTSLRVTSSSSANSKTRLTAAATNLAGD